MEFTSKSQAIPMINPYKTTTPPVSEFGTMKMLQSYIDDHLDEEYEGIKGPREEIQDINPLKKVRIQEGNNFNLINFTTFYSGKSKIYSLYFIH